MGNGPLQLQLNVTHELDREVYQYYKHIIYNLYNVCIYKITILKHRFKKKTNVFITTLQQI